MSKEVVGTTHETRQAHGYALEKEVVEVTCGDGTTYVFERPTDHPTDEFRFARAVEPSGSIETAVSTLPSAVSETVESVVSGWHK